MAQGSAIRIALELLHLPSRVRSLRADPLPADVQSLLRIAARDDEAMAAAVAATERSRDVLHQAATFYIEQILLTPDSDSYRILGAGREAADSELRRNMALLLRWLHPDIDRGGEHSIFAARVTSAWENLKTPQRRAAYDLRRPQAVRKARQRASVAPAKRRAPVTSRKQRAPNFLQRAVLFLRRAVWH